MLVGVLDDGLNEIPELEGQIDKTLSKDFGFDVVDGKRVERASGPTIGDSTSVHGTPIGAIIAAKNDGQGVQGFAPDAKLVSLRVDGMVDGERAYGLGMTDAIRYAADNKIPILNTSLTRKDETAVSSAAQSAIQYFHDNFKGLIVNSAGNDSKPNPNNYTDMTDTNKESLLFVVGLQDNGKSFSKIGFSNSCGLAKERCVAVAAYNGTHNVKGEFIFFGGTSSAAPVVSSVAAMILSKWPQLTGVDAGNIILKTARDIGEVGVDDVYGHGLVDVKAALSPVNPTVSNGYKASSVSGSVMVVGGAFGGGYGPSSVENAFDDITVLDAFGRDYSGDISGLVVRPASSDGHWLRRRMEAQTNAGGTGFVSPEVSASIGYTAFRTGLHNSDGSDVMQNHLSNATLAYRVSDKTSIVAGFNSGDNVMDDQMGLAPSSDAMFAYTPLAQTSIGMTHNIGNGRLAVSAYGGHQQDTAVTGMTVQWVEGLSSLKLGLVDETGTVFGTPVGAGAMRFGDGARTVFLEAATGYDLGLFRVDGYASMGVSRLKMADDMLMTKADAIASSRFGITASRQAFGGEFNFGVAQQLVALTGSATVTIGSGYDLSNRTLSHEGREVDLSGRMKPQVTIGYERTGERSSFRLSAASDLSADDVRAVGSWTAHF